MADFLALCKRYFGYALVFSLFINILQLTFSIYMLQVYDRVLTSFNDSTLYVITFAAVVALMTLAVLEWIRSRLLIRTGVEFERRLSASILNMELRSAADLEKKPDRSEIRDVQTLRSFLGSNAVFAYFDIPWMPIYFILIFILHPALGCVAVAGGLLVITFGVLTQKIAGPKLQEASEANRKAAMLLANATRNAATLKAMGMMDAISARWQALNKKVMSLQTRASRRVGLLHSISKSMRMGLQVVIYAVGAYLAITNQSSAGIMIAASIVMGRALAPIDQTMAAYKQSLEAKSAHKRIKAALESADTREKMPLPDPVGAISAENVTFAFGETATIKDVSFQLRPGTALAIVGPSGCGKSTLCKLLLGIWPPTDGKIRIDGAELKTWDSEKLGAFFGYLPQDVDLFAGTVAENIARMKQVDPEKVVKAAQLAGVHELILKLPNGYDTPIGDYGQGLSGGQRQRIGLARALYGDPCVIVLDEPNSNLDEEGEIRLMHSLKRLKLAGKTIVLVAHRPSVLAVVDEIMVLQEGGTVSMYGPRAMIMQKMAVARQNPGIAARRQEFRSRPQVTVKMDRRNADELAAV